MIVARAFGEKFDPDQHILNTEIKAVTYHDVKITKVKDKYNVTLVMDT